MIHPNIEKLSDDDVIMLIKNDHQFYELRGSLLSKGFRECKMYYNRGVVKYFTSMGGPEYFSNYMSLIDDCDDKLSLSFFSKSFDCRNSGTTFVKCCVRRTKVTKTFFLFGFPSINVYIMSKVRTQDRNDPKEARRFLSAMHYLADDLENGVGNRIYYVK